MRKNDSVPFFFYFYAINLLGIVQNFQSIRSVYQNNKTHVVVLGDSLGYNESFKTYFYECETEHYILDLFIKCYCRSYCYISAICKETEQKRVTTFKEDSSSIEE